VSFSRPSFRSHNYDIVIGWCPGSPCAICIHKCRRWQIHCMCHEGATLVETHSTYSQAQVGLPPRPLQAMRVKSMSRYSSCVCSLLIQLQLSPAVYCMSWLHVAARFIVWQVC
jgi:hypothetical protein